MLKVTERRNLEYKGINYHDDNSIWRNGDDLVIKPDDSEEFDSLCNEFFYKLQDRAWNYLSKKLNLDEEDSFYMDNVYLCEPVFIQEDKYGHYYLTIDPVNNYGIGGDYPYPVYDDEELDDELDSKDWEFINDVISIRIRKKDLDWSEVA